TVLDFGDGTSSDPIQYTVKAVNQGENWVLGDATVSHAYASAGPFTASQSSCCTIGELNNHGGGTFSAQALVDFTRDDESPRTSVPPIVDVGDSGVQAWNVPAVDSGGETRRWRLSTAAESCGGCEDPHPPGLAINPNTGRVTWDTTNQPTGLWYTSVTVEALNMLNNIVSTTQVNYLVRVGARGANQAPDWVSPPTPPDGSVFVVPPGSPVTIDLQAVDPDASDTVHIDNLGLPPGASFSSTDGNMATARFSWTPTSEQVGDHLLTVTAQDDQNPPAQAIARTYRITVAEDAQPPETTITSGPSGTTSSTEASFSFTSSEAGSTFECRLDGDAFAPCTSPQAYSGLAPGTHDFEVRATDPSGVVDPTPAARGWTVDSVPPDTPIMDGPPALGEDRTPTFTFSSTESGSRFECSLDGDPFAPCSSPYTTPELGPGEHTLVVRAIDAAGNVDPTPTVYNFEIEGIALDDLPDPTQGVDVNVVPVRGTVLIGVRRDNGSPATAGARASQKGIDFVPLREGRQIPVGSFLDTSDGVVALQSARNRAGDRQTGTFVAGLFQVRQSRKRRTRGLTTLALKGRSFRRCRSTRPHGRDASAARHRRRIRRVRGQARGRFRTRGRYSSATVRGTRWATIDRCDGTLTRVYRGRIAVRDFRRKRNILVTARDRSYFAKAPR
ncbi:MAG: putative Ig domain-containing protein, partial [Thermoleophilaceae bacterium]